jgi:ATP-binding cassette subfamily C protein CydC
MRPAKLLFRMTQDVEALDSLYLRVVVPMGAALAAALAAGVALGLMHPLLGLGAGSFLIVAGLGIPLVAARAAVRPARRRAQAVEILRSRAIDLVRGQTELAMAGRLAAQCHEIAEADRRQCEADDTLNLIETVVTAAFGIAGAVLLAATLYAVSLLSEHGAISAPLATLAVLIVLAAVEPFTALRRGALELGRTVLAAQRIAPRLTPVEAPTEIAAPPADLALRLTGVSARRGAALRPVLRGLSLALRREGRLALIGPSGAGKSTLMALLAGELLADAGTVEALPGTLLTQRTELFADSLRDNLRLANSKADDADIYRALIAAGLGDYVAALPRGLDTRLGEGGLGLSGGEGRRLTLARLFLRDTPVWLLDEPTEGLDAATARDVMARLATNAAGRALVIATHVRREAEIADRLVIIDGGRVIRTADRNTPEFDVALAGLRPE